MRSELRRGYSLDAAASGQSPAASVPAEPRSSFRGRIRQERMRSKGWVPRSGGAVLLLRTLWYSCGGGAGELNDFV